MIAELFPASKADAVLRVQYDHRPPFLKTIHLIASVFRQALNSLTVTYHRLLYRHPQRCEQNIEWKADSAGLIVFLHGLRNSPAVWHPQLALLQPHRKIDVFAPIVPKRGLCPLEEAAAPILPTIEDYIQKHPRNPLCLIGISNGSRIATWLETRLRNSSPNTPVSEISSTIPQALSDL